jgi:hypothetical protein
MIKEAKGLEMNTMEQFNKDGMDSFMRLKQLSLDIIGNSTFMTSFMIK